MISAALALALLVMGPPTGPTAPSRKAYSACLKKFTIESLEKKIEAQAFGPAVSNACSAEAAAFRNAVIAQEMASGLKRSEAEQTAKDELLDYQLNATEMYSEYLETNTRPG